MAGLDVGDWNRSLTTARLELVPLEPRHSDELVSVLGDIRLYRYTGGEPPALEELRQRYEGWRNRMSPDGTERWLNWIVRRRVDARAVGTVQSTVTSEHGRLVADVAWVIGVEHQGHGYASEAGQALVGWLFSCGVDEVVADIQPDHTASSRVASKIGLEPTEEWLLGERRWRRLRGP